MCRPMSGVLTRNETYWDDEGDSHEVILKGAHLKDTRLPPDFVRFEIAPEMNDYSLPLAKWIYKVDQDSVPEWYSAKAGEAQARDALEDWAKVHIIRDGKKHKLGKGAWARFVLDGELEIEELLSGGEVRSYGTSTLSVDTMSGGYVWSYDTSTLSVDTMSGGYVWSYDTLKLSVDTMSGGCVRSYGTSQLTIKNDKRRK